MIAPTRATRGSEGAGLPSGERGRAAPAPCGTVVPRVRAAGAELWQLARVRQWAPMLGLPLFGWMCARGGWNRESLARLGVAFACCAAYFAAGYALNECADRARRPGGAPAGAGRYGRGARRPYGVSFALAAGAVAGGFLWSRVAGLLALGGMIAGVLYSLPPVRAKGVPWAGLVLNAGGFTIPVLIGAAAAGDLESRTSAGAGLLFLCFLPIQLVHELAHRAEDRAAGDRTTALLLGARGTGRAIAAGLLGTLVWAAGAAYVGRAPWWWAPATLIMGIGVLVLVVRALRGEAGGSPADGIKATARPWFAAYGLVLAVGTLWSPGSA